MKHIYSIGIVLTHIDTILTSFGYSFHLIDDQHRKSNRCCRKHMFYVGL